ncbi:MAG: PQQ-like beta-propeller repeat protein, partial [Opitutae bacterium]|nr:PQQ-like beta-propeller repeat protein [Opitutae bacterium]
MKINLFIFSVFITLCHVSSAGDWPGWRGEERNDLSKETGLLQAWPEGGPENLWVIKLGGLGYSGFSIANDHLFTLGAFGKEEKLLAFNASTGKKAWELTTGELLTNNWGDGPRMTPSVSNGLVYALGGRGNLVCADAKTGKQQWKVHLVKDLGGKVPGWGYTESVLIDQGRVICTPGGSNGALAALDAKSGEVLWRSKEFTDGAQYSSPIVIESHGKRQYVQLVMKNLVGVEAKTGGV